MSGEPLRAVVTESTSSDRGAENRALNGNDLATVLAAVADAASKGPAALAVLAKALATKPAKGDAIGKALPENPIAIVGDADGVSNPKGHDAMKVFGPYPHRGRWRILIRLERKQKVRSFATESDARSEMRRLRVEAHKNASVTVEKAIESYAEQLKRNGLKEKSIETVKFRLRRFFETALSAPFATISTSQAKQVYESLSKLAVDTRLNMLALAKCFCRKARENGWTDITLLADIKPEGKRRCGKPKLSLDESRKYLATCLAQASSTDSKVRQIAIAASMPLVFGLRSGEVLNRQVKDLDDNGRILRITSAKSKAGIRSLQVPEWFRPYLLDLAKGLKPDDKSFPREKTWLHRHVVNFCKLAGVSRVVPHGLRGTHGDLAIVAAATPVQVSQALGHESLATTVRHYVSAELVEATAHQAAMSRLVRNDLN
jgi:integrase